MVGENAQVDVAVVGAGAGGIGAARTLRARGVSFALLEASHRIGGRAYTERVGDGQPFDLGCHWLHSASLNPFVAVADAYGFHYDKAGYARSIHFGDRWANEGELQDYVVHFERTLEAACRAGTEGRDISIADASDREGRWSALFDYIVSLMHSADSDQVSVRDLSSYRDTDENWPIKEGYGTLIARFGADLPASLNSAVRKIDWSGKRVRLDTARGTVTAGRVILTVSTGILGGGDIRFTPDLPDWKREAVAALPLGNHNRICLLFDRNVFGENHPPGVTLLESGSEPIGIRLRPFNYDYAVGFTGGRFADWLERAGTEASADLVKEKLVKVFGSAIAKHVVGHTVTAWRGDPWVRGAYSAAQPGQGHQRLRLAEPVDGRLYFAGEATSPDFFATAHGAYLSGIAAAEQALAHRATRAAQ